MLFLWKFCERKFFLETFPLSMWSDVLKPGLNVSVKEEVRGFKRLISCKEESLHALAERHAPREFKRCEAEVLAAGTIVWPTAEARVLNPDLRASDLAITSMT